MTNSSKQHEGRNATSHELTRAAERYLEQYGDPVVMNTYLKVTILVLAGIVVLLARSVYRGQMAWRMCIRWYSRQRCWPRRSCGLS